MSNLKCCPFCGSTNVELRFGMFFNGAVHCNNCTADVVFGAVKLVCEDDSDWQNAVIEGWNRRVNSD